jgi:SAM-dependent methyltransferase
MIETLLAEYSKTPDDCQVILSIANEAASMGNNELAMLFSQHGLSKNPDAVTRIKLLEQASISGFYCKSSIRKDFGKNACETLALDRTQSWQTRNLARQNSTYYATGSVDLFPGTRITETGFVPPDDYKAMNPSIYNCNGELWMIQRTVNYVIRPDGSYDMRGDSAIRTRNWLLKLHSDLSVQSAEEIFPPLDLADPLYNLVIGWEDCRLFWWQNDFYCTSTVRELNQEGFCEIVLSHIKREDDGLLHFADYRVIHPVFCGKEHQKNWMPMVVNDDLYWMYSSDSARIINPKGEMVSEKITHIAADSFRGGSQLIPFDGGWLAIIHESHTMPDNRRRYMHRFIWYDALGRVGRFTKSFYIDKLGIEFAAGIAKHPESGNIIVSFGLADKESWLAVFDQQSISDALQPAGIVAEKLGDLSDTSWMVGQTNKALLSMADVETASAIASKAGIKSHEDRTKNWDNMIAITHACITTDPSFPVMDVAATEGSSFLPTLARFGYQHLFSINIDEPNPRTVNGVSYMLGDCTKTQFDDGYFGFISCLSVIEHGVDINAFFAESSRILRKGGHLIVSTDYWQDPVDTFGQTAFGAPVKVFTAQEMESMILTAKSNGLEITGDVYLTCNERVVNWIGMDYTFVNLLFRKI